MTDVRAVEDEVVYDDPDPDRYVYDAAFVGSGFTDVACDLINLEIESGMPDELGLFESGRAVLTLANPTGRYTSFTADGQLTYFAPGRKLSIWAADGGIHYWLANMRVDRWAPQADDTVVVEASDGFALLAREQGDYTPGVAGQTPLERITAIAVLAGFPDAVDGDTGNVNLTRQLTDRSPLEEIQIVALSDGGLVHVDTDGVLLYRNRLWPAGRPDQLDDLEHMPTFTDNVCTGAHVVWDLELAAGDDALANWVRLTNVAGLVSTATADTMSGLRYPLVHPDADQWTTQAEGDDLALALIAQKSVPRVAVESFTLHVHDPKQDLWRAGIDRRIGDRIRFLRHQVEPDGGMGVLDIVAIVSTIRHTITPDAWVTELATTRSTDFVTVEEWDHTAWVWDDPDDLDALWRY